MADRYHGCLGVGLVLVGGGLLAASYKGVLPVEKKTELVESIADITTNRAPISARGDRGFVNPGAIDDTVEVVGTGAVAATATAGTTAAVDTTQPVVISYALRGETARNDKGELVQATLDYRAENQRVFYAINDLLEEVIQVAGHQTPSQELATMRTLDGNRDRTITADEIFRDGTGNDPEQRYTPRRGNGSRVILEDSRYVPPQATNQPGARPPRTTFRNRNSGHRGNK